MTNELQTFTTDSTPGEEQFEQTVSKAVEQYQDHLYGREYYGPATDATLHYAIRAALVHGELSPVTLYDQFGESKFDRDAPDADGLREVIENCSPDQRREMWERAESRLRNGSTQ